MACTTPLDTALVLTAVLTGTHMRLLTSYVGQLRRFRACGPCRSMDFGPDDDSTPVGEFCRQKRPSWGDLNLHQVSAYSPDFSSPRLKHPSEHLSSAVVAGFLTSDQARLQIPSADCMKHFMHRPLPAAFEA